MLILSNSELPTENKGYVSSTGRLFRLYSNEDERDWNGILATVSHSSNYGGEVESIDLGIPSSKGYFHRLNLTRNFKDFYLDGYRQVNSPTKLFRDRFWVKDLVIGIYSVSSLEGTITPSVTQYQNYRNLSNSYDVVLSFPSLALIAEVASGGYVYAAGSGEDQYEYSDPLLTIHTTDSSRALPNQTVIVKGEKAISVAAPSLQILSFVLEPDNAIVGIEYMGISFVKAPNVYNPLSGQFTFSSGGILNLYFPMEVQLPAVQEIDQVKQLVVNTGSLTYNRPV